MSALDAHIRDLLLLTLTPGLGPVLIARLLAAFGSADRAIAAEPAKLRAVRGIGPERAAAVCKGLRESRGLLDAELAEIDRRGVTLVARGTAGYPPLLDQCVDAPPLLYVRGRIDARENTGPDRHALGIVGSRNCTPYGTEQAERFAALLGSTGITIVSGGARGIDTAAHRAALLAGGRTIAVLGCGLCNCYPPDNAELFEQIAADGGARGAVVSELPMTTPPSDKNFPARNRIIAGLSLGVLLIEAGRGSGALITARQAIDLGREVFALPGRVDSPASEGSLGMLKESAAALVTEPADILNQLESPARHLYNGTHEVRYTPLQAGAASGLFQPAPVEQTASTPVGAGKRAAALTPSQQAFFDALDKPRTLDEVATALGAEPAALRADLTMLEIRKLVKREGTRLARA